MNEKYVLADAEEQLGGISGEVSVSVPTLSRTEVAEGDDLGVDVTVTNNKTYSATATVEILIDGGVFGQTEVLGSKEASIDVSESRDLSYTFSWSQITDAVDPGTYSIKAETDTDSKATVADVDILEPGEESGGGTGTGLEVVDVRVTNFTVKEGDQFCIQADVKNNAGVQKVVSLTSWLDATELDSGVQTINGGTTATFQHCFTHSELFGMAGAGTFNPWVQTDRGPGGAADGLIDIEEPQDGGGGGEPDPCQSDAGCGPGMACEDGECVQKDKTVNLPVVGEVKQSTALVMGGGLVVGLGLLNRGSSGPRLPRRGFR